MTNETHPTPSPNPVEIALPKHVLRALYGAMAKGDVRYYLNHIAIDVRDEAPVLVTTNGHAMVTFTPELSPEAIADLKAIVATCGTKDALLSAPGAKPGTSPTSLRVDPDGKVHILSSNGLWHPTEPHPAGPTYPDWRRVDAWRSPDAPWELGTGPVGLDAGLIHAIWPGGWTIWHDPEKEGFLRALVGSGIGTSGEVPDIKVTVMGRRVDTGKKKAK